MVNSFLPPLPASDADSLDRNKYDGFYKVKSRDFWGDNVIERIEEKPNVKCTHEFMYTEGGAECKKCHFGLLGPLEIQNGKLFFKGEPIGL